MSYSKSTVFKNCLKPFAVCLVFTSFFVNAQRYEHGRVSMNGEIVDSACSLDMANSDQTIDMLTQPISEIISNTEGLPKPLTISLQNCSLQRASKNSQQGEDWNYFQITFDGERSDKYFGVSGDAGGVALEIYDQGGNMALPGEPMPQRNIQPGASSMKYFIKLVGDGKTLQPGAYHTTIRYKLDYY
ncbi:fimbrial protein [Dryocola clanedunensis]